MTFTFKATPAPKPTTFGDIPVGTAFRVVSIYGSGPTPEVWLKVNDNNAKTEYNQPANTVRLSRSPCIVTTDDSTPVQVVPLECKEVQV